MDSHSHEDEGILLEEEPQSPVMGSHCHEREGILLEPRAVLADRRGRRAGLVVGAAGVAALLGLAGTARYGMVSKLSGLQSKEAADTTSCASCPGDKPDACNCGVCGSWGSCSFSCDATDSESIASGFYACDPVAHVEAIQQERGLQDETSCAFCPGDKPDICNCGVCGSWGSCSFSCDATDSESIKSGFYACDPVAHVEAIQQERGPQDKEAEERVLIVPSHAACSKAGDDCTGTRCCQVSGHKCFTKGDGRAECSKTCTAGEMGFTCDVLGGVSVPVARSLEQSLYCFSVYTENTGNDALVNHELELLNIVAAQGAGIFACEEWDVFSDVSVPIDANGYVTIKVEDEFGEFHQLKRKTSGTWVNWGIFYQVWVKVREVGKYNMAEYTVKLDADAVFLPQRLRAWLSSKPGDSERGLYFENCPNVEYGFFGHLEIITKTAVSVLLAHLEECHLSFAPCANDGCDWEWGPWGEDVFTQRCMDHHLVDKAEAFDVAMDGACEADRPEGQKENKKWYPEDCSQLTTVTAHPLKQPAAFKKCLAEMS